MTCSTKHTDKRVPHASVRWLITAAAVVTCLACGDTEAENPGAMSVFGAEPGPSTPTNGPMPAGPTPGPTAGVGATPPAPTVPTPPAMNGPGPNPVPSPAPTTGPSPSAEADAGMDPMQITDAGAQPDAGAPDAGGPAEVCPLPQSYRWTSTGPIAQPKNGALSLKDFTHVFHAGKHIIYMTTNNGNWGSAMFMFDDWDEAGSAQQIATGFGVAPTLFYFKPKDLWVLAYQWGRYKFSYRTSSDPTNPNSWSQERSLYNTALPPNGTGPIDQTVICDSERCYLYYAGDNGHIYKSSMPIDDFPGEFAGAQDSGIQGTTQNLFEGVQVYSIEGSDEYLMLVEAQSGSGRYFRAWTATNLNGPWTLLTDEFARKSNVTFSTSWTNDISHGDLIRSRPDETMPIDPCNLQLLYQGRDPNINVSYGRLPYRPGLLTLQP